MSAPPASLSDHKGARSSAVPNTNTTTTSKAKDLAAHMRPEKKATPAVPAPILNNSNQNVQNKKVSRRSSKPIINWFQRKLAGTGKTKRTENVPLRIADLGLGRSGPAAGRQINRITSSPLPVQMYGKHQTRPEAASLARRKTRSISLYGDEEREQYTEDDQSVEQSSLNRESMSIWSPGSAVEADDDASVRPIPPSAPPSPSPSRSSSSYLSDFRTFRSMAASTKPTTVLSIDLNGNGMAHIAQAPTPPPTQVNRFAPHVRQSSSLSSAGLLGSGASITFSSIPAGQPSSRPTSLRNPGSIGSMNLNTLQNPPNINHTMSAVQAPLHTSHHPRNNPRPSSPPMDNASVLTLASSAFGFPNRLGTQHYPPSAVGDSVSHFGGSVTFPDAESASQYVPGEDDRLEERDFDASVRALRPRSSRRGSWESEASKWSAGVQGTPSLARDRSLWTANSLRTGTGHFSTENGENYDGLDDQTQDDITREDDEYGKCESPVALSFQELQITVDRPPESPVVADPPAHMKEVVSTPSSSDDSSSSAMVLPRRSTETIAQPDATPQMPSQELSDEKEPLASASTETSQSKVDCDSDTLLKPGA
ncbi:hypothetical protein D9613_005479 [Agrocybe pediades]|uniref:Uncharacterized protein n=1 Tax=Agrocybe pediades TaxID=84607 RepID=A0A8H4QY22_9AGAR|nr:hypothetical protein D9613_005479 [Agrocybe pediades]KAF9569476.1 hypothetical protein CPC08DRAFT_701959 [Agrocybe pediades]